jgi:hypothetical protein
MTALRSEIGPMEYLTLSRAKPRIGRLMDRVLKLGEPVIIRRGNRFVQITEYVIPDPIPYRPIGYFAVSETAAEYEQANRLARLSPDTPE